MSIMRLEPAPLRGSIKIQPAKAHAHRSIICAALAKGVSVIRDPGDSDDVKATVAALGDLGLACFKREDENLLVYGGKPGIGELTFIDCGESGSTLRFLLPLALHTADGARFTGRGRLLQRPMLPYLELLRSHGASIENTAEFIEAKGKLEPGDYCLAGNISSQYFSGLLFALPLFKEESRIKVIGELESAPYLELTRQMQKRFNINSYWQDRNTLIVSPGRYEPAEIVTEADWSHAAFFLVAGAIAGKVECLGLKIDSLQADRRIIEILGQMHAEIEPGRNYVKASAAQLEGLEIDASQIPDLVPVLSVAACAAKTPTRIKNASRLRMKESDRLKAVYEELQALGADIEETADGLLIRGKGYLEGGKVQAHGDHRIAMSLAVAASISRDLIEIDGWQTVSKSAPRFWQEYKSLGGIAHEC